MIPHAAVRLPPGTLGSRPCSADEMGSDDSCERTGADPWPDVRLVPLPLAGQRASVLKVWDGLAQQGFFTALRACPFQHSTSSFAPTLLISEVLAAFGGLDPRVAASS